MTPVAWSARVVLVWEVVLVKELNLQLTSSAPDNTVVARAGRVVAQAGMVVQGSRVAVVAGERISSCPPMVPTEVSFGMVAESFLLSVW